jgi:hypothetical protein
MKSDGKEGVDGVQKCRKISAKVIRWDTGLLMAKEPTGGNLEVRDEELRCYLWALALHWPRKWWYECKIR